MQLLAVPALSVVTDVTGLRGLGELRSLIDWSVGRLPRAYTADRTEYWEL